MLGATFGKLPQFFTMANYRNAVALKQRTYKVRSQCNASGLNLTANYGETGIVFGKEEISKCVLYGFAGRNCIGASILCHIKKA